MADLNHKCLNTKRWVFYQLVLYLQGQQTHKQKVLKTLYSDIKPLNLQPRCTLFHTSRCVDMWLYVEAPHED